MRKSTSIESAASRCRAAFAKVPEATWAWCCHHEVLAEKLTETFENRISYILTNKPVSEQVTRLDNFRPVTDMENFQTASAEFEKVRQTAEAEYDKVRQTALAEFEKVRQPALAEYEKVRQTAWEEYEKVCQPAWKEFEKIYQTAAAEFEKVCQTAWEEYEKVCQPAWEEFEKVRRTALAEYEKVLNSAWDLSKIKELYKKEVLMGTWNGASIFDKL